jgi:hypothetical protein
MARDRAIWRKSYAQYAVQAQNNMAFSVWKRMFFLESYLKTQPLQPPIWMSRACRMCDMEVCETVQADRTCERTETCSHVTETHIAKVSERLRANE